MALSLVACWEARGTFATLQVDHETAVVTWTDPVAYDSDTIPRFGYWPQSREAGWIQVEESAQDGRVVSFDYLDLGPKAGSGNTRKLRGRTTRRQVFDDGKRAIWIVEETAFAGGPTGDRGSRIHFVMASSEAPLGRQRPLMSGTTEPTSEVPELVSLLRATPADAAEPLFAAVSYAPSGEPVSFSRCELTRTDDVAGATPQPGADPPAYRCSHGIRDDEALRDVFGLPARLVIDSSELGQLGPGSAAPDAGGGAQRGADLDLLLLHEQGGRRVQRLALLGGEIGATSVVLFEPTTLDGLLEPLMAEIDYGLGITGGEGRAPQ